MHISQICKRVTEINGKVLRFSNTFELNIDTIFYFLYLVYLAWWIDLSNEKKMFFVVPFTSEVKKKKKEIDISTIQYDLFFFFRFF